MEVNPKTTLIFNLNGCDLFIKSAAPDNTLPFVMATKDLGFSDNEKISLTSGNNIVPLENSENDSPANCFKKKINPCPRCFATLFIPPHTTFEGDITVTMTGYANLETTDDVIIDLSSTSTLNVTAESTEVFLHTLTGNGLTTASFAVTHGR